VQAAFLMVEYLALPYQTIILAAIVPAFMHFFGVFCQVHFEAKKLGMRGMTADELPRISEVVRRDWPTSIPLFVLLNRPVLGLHALPGCVLGHHGLHRARPHQPQPGYRRHLLAAVVAPSPLASSLSRWALLPSSAACIAAGIYYVLRDADGRARLIDLVDAFVMGAKYAISVGAAAATVGIIVGVVTLTGVGFKLSAIITELSQRSARPFAAPSCRPCCSTPRADAVLHTGDDRNVCILLGCGVPTTPTYIIMVTIAAPALAMMGVRRWCRTSSSSTTACWPTSHRPWRSPPMPVQAWPAPIPSRPATRLSASASPRPWCHSSSSIRRRCCW
jgi:TRAP-type uncharacterized transport system fused permease subunit